MFIFLILHQQVQFISDAKLIFFLCCVCFEGLIYLPEIKYRRILNIAFGPGGWALVPRGDSLQFQVTFDCIRKLFAYLIYAIIIHIIHNTASTLALWMVPSVVGVSSGLPMLVVPNHVIVYVSKLYYDSYIKQTDLSVECAKSVIIDLFSMPRVRKTTVN